MLKALDLFCGAGGATRGLQQAGFHVTGVDLKSQPRYPGNAFIRADALKLPLEIAGFDLVWASPPCQAFSVMRHCRPEARREHPNLIPATRELLAGSRALTIIENVAGAPLINPVRLCGLMFGLKVYRHRLFELNFDTLVPPHTRHKRGSTIRGG